MVVGSVEAIVPGLKRKRRKCYLGARTRERSCESMGDGSRLMLGYESPPANEYEMQVDRMQRRFAGFAN